LAPSPAHAARFRVGLRQFSGDHDAVFLIAWTDKDLDRVVSFALSIEPSETLMGPEAGRTALKQGYLIGNAPSFDAPMSAVEARAGQAPITWAEQLGRPVMQIQVSPDAQHILAKCSGYHMVDGEFQADGPWSAS